MKEMLTQYAAYNQWANNLIIEAMLQLPEESTALQMSSSFSSLMATVLHTWSAEHIWLQRMQQVTEPEWKEATFNGSFADACAGWRQTSAQALAFVAQQTHETLKDRLSFRDRKGDARSMTLHQIMLHMFNHTTYHRGQMVTMMRKAGATLIPQTDFIAWAMLHGQ